MAILGRVVQRILDIPSRGLPNFRQRKMGDEFDGYKILTAPFQKNFAHGFRYEPIHEDFVRYSFELLEIDFSQFTFIDIGCGKGRPLKIASEYGFKNLIGVEYSRPLAQDAMETLSELRIKFGSIYVCDAADFKFPDGPKVIFMYNPFDGVVLRKMMANLLKSEGEIFLIYVGEKRELAKEWLEPWKGLKDTIIYRRSA